MKTLLFLILIILPHILFSQQGGGGQPYSFKEMVEKKVHSVKFPKPDIVSLRSEDAISDRAGTGPWRFGFNNYTDLSMENSGTWFELKDGSKLWLLRVECQEALSVNLTFSRVSLPEGNELYVYNPEKNFILGKFTEDHLYKGNLGTELIPGNTAILEYYIPASNSSKSFGLHLDVVTHGYRTAGEFQLKAFGSSGSCNSNVNCPEGSTWTNERNSVVMLVSGSSGFCSGALVNNVLNDGKPYVLTADHCYSDPTTWIFRFNWQSPDCNNPSSSPGFQSISGAVLRARASASDFCLVEITGGLIGNTVPLSFSPYFAGWDNSGSQPLSAVGIHHPSGDIKKICFENDPLVSTSFGDSPPNSHWGVTRWDIGVTEPGSSGSPLFDQNHRIVGQLHGGSSACGTNQLSDEYGKFSYSWNPSGSNSKNQLKYWLDPNSSGASFVDGYDPGGSSALVLDAGITNPKGVSGTFCEGIVFPEVNLSNSGNEALTSAIITYGYDGKMDQTYLWTGKLDQWQITNVTLPADTLESGSHSFSALVSEPNSGKDENPKNNQVSSTFKVVINGENITLNFKLDCWGSENSWMLTEASNGSTLFSGAGYVDNPKGDSIIETFCLNEGCYIFTLNDEYGDGLTGCQQSEGGNGSYIITWNGDVLAELPGTAANFGKQIQSNFCVNFNSIHETNANTIQISPNPARESVSVILEENTIVDQLSLFDLSGKLLPVPTTKLDHKMVLDVSTLSPGYYVIRIKTDRGELNRKLMKQ